MNYLADTTVLIDHLRGKKEAQQFILESEPHISTVSMAELIQGSRDKTELDFVLAFTGDLSEIPIDKRICRRAIKLISSFYLPHGLKFLDALVAATALENGLVLVTDNIKHFKHIEGLKAISHKDAF